MIVSKKSENFKRKEEASAVCSKGAFDTISLTGNTRRSARQRTSFPPLCLRGYLKARSRLAGDACHLLED